MLLFGSVSVHDVPKIPTDLPCRSFLCVVPFHFCIRAQFEYDVLEIDHRPTYRKTSSGFLTKWSAMTSISPK